uniref:Serine protease n=1 Tax=Riboviria sp. TaxID=2585031 RepID=A0A8K1U2E9_9VIRU|nr:MAG: hypothetical protein 1 [Riboviria sp.]
MIPCLAIMTCIGAADVRCMDTVIQMQVEIEQLQEELAYYKGWRFAAVQWLHITLFLAVCWGIIRAVRFVSWVCYRTKTGILNMKVWINPLNWFSLDLEKTAHYVPERVRDGSSLYVGDVPNIQCSVYNPSGPSTWNMVAQGFRYGKFFVSAAHAIRGQERVLLKRGDAEVEVEEKSFSFIDDLAYAVIGLDAFATLGMKTAALMDVVGSAYVTVSAGGQRSNGKVKPSSFGFVEYDGSTLPGFSGAPYCINRQVYGMHLGGNDRVNMGYDSGFVKTLIEMFDEKKRHRSYITTDQEWEFVKNMEFKSVSGNPDLWLTRSQGKYTTLNEEEKAVFEEGGRLIREGKIRTKGQFKAWKAREKEILGLIHSDDWRDEATLVPVFDHREPEVLNADFPKANVVTASPVGQQQEKAVASSRNKRKSAAKPTLIAPLKGKKVMECPVPTPAPRVSPSNTT